MGGKGRDKEEPAPRRGQADGETGRIVVSTKMAHGTEQSMKFLDPETLEDNFDALERYICQSKRDVIKEWVDTYGAAFCRSQIDFLSD